MNYKKLIFYSYFFSLHIIVFFLVFKSINFSKFYYKIKTINNDAINFKQTTMRIHRNMDTSVPTGSILFFGDSITQGLCVSAVGDNCVNFGIGSLKIHELSEHIKQLKSIHDSNTIVINIGINDIIDGDFQKQPNEIANLVNHLPKNKNIIWISTLPVNFFKLSINNNDIISINKTIKNICEKNKYYYLDIYVLFFSKNNQIIEKYFQEDGVHLSGDGYKIIINELKSHFENKHN